MRSAQMPLQSDIKAIFNAEKPFISHRLCNTNYMNDDGDDKWKHRCVYCAICVACLTTSVYHSRVVGSCVFFLHISIKCQWNAYSFHPTYCSHFIIQPPTHSDQSSASEMCKQSYKFVRHSFGDTMRTKIHTQIDKCFRWFSSPAKTEKWKLRNEKKKVFAAAQRFELNYECVCVSFGCSLRIHLIRI